MAPRTKISAAKPRVLSATLLVSPNDMLQSPDHDFDMQFLKFLDGRRSSGDLIDPLSDDGLRLQALYVQSFSQHPMDVLRRIMENAFGDPKDRISAAKTLLEYSQRKPPAQLAVKAEGLGLKLDPSSLAKLSTKDLDTLEALLTKASNE